MKPLPRIERLEPFLLSRAAVAAARSVLIQDSADSGPRGEISKRLLNLETAWQQVEKGRGLAGISRPAKARRIRDAKSGRAAMLDFFDGLSPEHLEHVLGEIARTVRPAIAAWHRVEGLAVSKGMPAFELRARLDEVHGNPRRVARFQRDHRFSEREHAVAIRLMAEADRRMTAARKKFHCGYREVLAASVVLEQWLAAAGKTGAAKLASAAPNGTSAAHEVVSPALSAFQRVTADMPKSTEAERLAVQRIGQDLFRKGLLEYWEGRCAVTGLAVPALLRASHIKPWAACETDAERLDVFNGLLLAPHLDALFDGGWLTVLEDGAVHVSGRLVPEARAVLGVAGSLRLERLTGKHYAYLAWHRATVFDP